MNVREERHGDQSAIRLVEQDAFEGPTEADLVEALHAAGDVVLSLVMEHEGEIIGHILFSRLNLPGVQAVAVTPAVQRRGVGSALVRAGLDLLRKRGEQAVFVLGHREFYPRFGFRADLAARFESPYAGESFFALELAPGALQGKSGPVTFADAFRTLP
jgi:putative acetyltransferase